MSAGCSTSHHQRSFITPSGILQQITIVVPEGRELLDCVKRKGRAIAIKSGNYAREASARAKKWRQ